VSVERTIHVTPQPPCSTSVPPGGAGKRTLRIRWARCGSTYANAMRKAGLRPWVAGHPVTYGFAAAGTAGDHALQEAWREELIGGAR
jgi:hypothetical protein